MLSARSLKTLVIAAAFVSAPAQAQRGSEGDWRLYLDSDRRRVELTFWNDDNHQWQSSTSFPVDASQLEGLSFSQMRGSPAAAKFRLRRDAGTFSFEGTAGDDRGRGTFVFEPSSAFNDQLARRGYSRPSLNQQLSMAMHDVSLALIDEIAREGYGRPTVGGLVEMGEHGVNLEYVRGLDSFGYRVRTVDMLVEMRDHGVTASFIEGMSGLGYKLTREQLVTARDHGVTPSFIQSFRDLGYRDLSINQVIELRDHGVTASYAERALDRMKSRPSISDLIDSRDRGLRY